VRLVAFEKKEGKYRESVLLKLLHKAENVAQEVYDYLGIRLVTPTRTEAVFAMKYLIDHHLVSFPNIMPSRCKNTLVDLDEFHEKLQTFVDQSVDHELKEIDKLETKLSFPKGMAGENPFSSDHFRAIQFTSRPLIRIPVRRKSGVRGEVTFFFPMEVQIMDGKSYLQSQKGDAEHAKYKEKQLEAVRARVLQGIDSR